MNLEQGIKTEHQSKITIVNICFYITLISNLAIYIAQPLDIILLEGLASKCFMLSNMVAFLYALIHSMKEYIPYKTNQIITIAFILLFSFISFITSKGSGLYQYIIRMWCYLALPFYLLYMDYISLGKKMINFVFIINYISSGVFILLSLSKYSYAGYEHYIGTNYAWLTLGYGNPNQTGIYLMITFVVLLCAFSYYKSPIMKGFTLLVILYIGRLIILTSSRSCIIVCLFILTAVFLYPRLNIPKLVVAAILLLPMIFLLFYPYLIEQGWFVNDTYMGKEDYSSRSSIFTLTLKKLQKRYLFGDFGTYRLENLHNGVLSILSSLGIIGLILFYIYYFRAYFHILKHYIKTRTAYISFVGLLAIFIHACAEGAFLVGGSVFAGSVSVLILLIKVEEREGEEH